MSNLTPEGVDLRLTSVHSLLDEEDMRLWEGLEDEKISRIAGGEANKQFTAQVQTANQGTESRLSTEVIHRSEGDINNITSLNALAQALSDYRIKTDLEINQEKIAREQLGIELNSRIGILESSFSHREFKIYQAISDVQTDVNFKYDALDVRVRKYEEMLQDITTDSIQITMDNGEINMGAWTILSQAREWDLEILANVKVYQDKTTGDLNQALIDLQARLPVEQDIIDKAIEGLGNSQIIKDLDDRLEASAADVSNVRLGLIKETQDRQDQMLGMAQDNANEFAKQSKELGDQLQAETNARILAVQREAAIRQQELLAESADRTAEIDEKIAELEVEIGDLSVIHGRIDAVEGKVTELDTKLTADIAGVNQRVDGINTKVDGLDADLTAKIAAVDTRVTNINAAAALLDKKVDANKLDADTKHTALITKTDATNAAVKAEETARIAAIKTLDDGLTAEIQFRKDGDTANLTAINNYKTSNDAALANVRNELAVNVTATTVNATAISALDVRLTTNETETATAKSIAASATQKADTALTETAALATQMTTVNASIEDIKTDLGSKADATAVTKLQADVTKIDGRVTANTSAITALNTTVGTLDGTVKGHTSAITGLETKQTQQGNAINQLTTDTTALKSDVTTIQGDLATKVEATAFNQLKTEVTQNGKDIDALTSSVTSLGTKIDTVEDLVNTKADSSAVTALETKVTNQGDTLTSQGNAITKLSTDLAITDGKVASKADASALTALDSKVTKQGTDITSQGSAITKLTSDLAVTNATVASKADSTALTALDNKVTTIDGKVTSQGSAITALTGRVTKNEGDISKKAESSAVAALESVVTEQGKDIATNSTSITTLEGRVATNETNISKKADGLAVTALETKVSQQGDVLTSHGTSITKLTNDLAVTDGKVATKADASALTTLDNKVTQQGTTITSQGSAITKLTNDLKTTDDKVNTKADASALTALDTKVTLVDGKVTSQGNQLTQLKNTIDGIELEIDGKADSSALTALDSKVTKQGTDIASNTSAITALNGKVSVVEGELTKKADATAVNNLTTRVYTAEGKITSQGTAITKLTSDLATTDAKVSTKADASALTALDTKVTQQGNTITSQGSAITKLTNDLSVTNQNVAKKADAAALTALTSTVTALDGKVVSNTSAITSLSGRVTSVEGTLTTKADASALNNYYTKVEANNATAGAISSFNATLRVGGTNLYKGTKSFTGSWWSAGNTVIDTTQTYKGFTVRKSTGQWGGIKQIFPAGTFPVGSKVVLSLYAKGATNGQPMGVYTNGTSGAFLVGGSTNQVTLTTEWKRYEFVATVNSSTDTIQLRPENTSLNGTVFLCGLMFEAATIPSDWSPAPEDIDAAFVDQGSAIAANSAAITSTNTEVTRINGVVTTHGTSITKLQTDLSVVDGKVNTKADSSALTALDSKVTTQGGAITSQGNAITKLTNDLATTNADVATKASTSALNALDTKVTEQDGKITAQGTSINKLTSDLALTNAEVSKKADSSALTMLDTKVTGIDNKVTSQSTALTKLTSDVTTLTGEVSKKADASALTTLDTKVTAIDGRVTSNTSAITSLNSRVTTAEGDIAKKADASVLVNYSTKTETDTAIATSMTKLDAELQSRGNNLLADGGFEKYTATTGNAVVFKAEKYAGTQSLRFFRSEATGNGNNNDVYIGNYFNISQGRILYIEVYARKDPTATVVPPANSNVRVGVNFRDAAGVFKWSGIDVPMATLTDSWVKHSGYITVPAGAIEARQWLSIASVNNVQNSSILLDNVYIYDATEGRSASLVGATNATAIQTLDTKVTAVDGKVVSQGTAVTKLESGLKGVIASSLDLISNPAFDPLYDQMGFSVVGSTTAGVPAGCPFPYVARLATREHTPSFYGVPCKQGDVFELSALVACAEGGTVPFNHYVYKFTSPTVNAGASGYGGQVQPTQTWTRTTWRFTVPANFNYIKPFLQVSQFAPFNTVWYATDWHCVNVTAASKAQAIADANATAIQTLDSKVVQQGKDITSQSTAQTALTNRVSTVEGQVTLKADSSAVQQLESRVTLSEGKITSNTNAITNLSGTVTTLDGKVSTKADASALNNYYTKVQADSATAGHISSFSAGLQVGGGNIYLKSKSFTGEPWIHGNTAPDATQTYRGLAVRKTIGQWGGPYQNISGPLYPAGTKLVFSLYAKAETNGQLMGLYVNNATTVTAVGAVPAATNQVALTTEWKRYIFTTSVASNTGNIQLRPENPSTTGTIYMCGLQLELGTVPSEWGDAASELIEYYGETSRITIDASLLDPDTYYAVITALPQVGRSYLSIENALTATNGKPAWSSHANGFSLRLAWTSNGSAYGSVGVERRIIDFAHKFAAQSPVFNVRQYTNSSNEAVYVRGGAKYNFVVSRGLAPRLLTADLVVSDQTIPFKLAYSASLLPVTTDTTVSANASAITTTNAEVTRINGVVVAQGTSITNLTATVVGKADTSAVNTLQATVTQQGKDITANATATTNLTNRVTLAEGKITANTAANTALSNKVTEIDGRVTAQASSITQVEAKLNTLNSFIISTHRNGANSAGTLPQGLYTSNKTRLFTFNRGLNLLVWNATGTTATITSYDTYATLDNALTLSNAIEALAANTYFTVVGRDNLGNVSTHTDLKNSIIANGGSADYFAKWTGTYMPIFTTKKGQFTNTGIQHGFSSTVVNDAIAYVLNIVGGIPDGLAGATPIDESKFASAAALTSLDAKVTVIDGKTTATATSLSQLSTKVDGNSAAIAVQGTTINGIQAEYSIKLDVNGMVSGIGLINTGSSSAISMNADMFYIGKAGAGGKKPFMVLTSPQTIGGVTYPAGTWIDVALIANATIGTAHIADASITNAKIKELDASKITTGILNANRIRVGPTSTFDEGYNPASKARTFIAQPTVPYSVGDIWKNGTSTYICKTRRVAGSFTAAEWDKVGDVTSENTAANANQLGGTAASTINTNISNADSKAVAADTKATNAAATAATADGKATAADTKAGQAQTLATTANFKATAADSKATLAQSTANSANNQVNAWKFTGTTEIDGGNIRSDTVTAAQINVDELSAISTNLGTFVSGDPTGQRTVITGSNYQVFDANNVERIFIGVR